ncbi:MAG: lactonase family protein [Kiritimatiellae bacterium]|nr:lactonase family protein [Kiritimatiellia bacterium]
MLVYAGTYTAKGSEGIYVFGFNEESGALAPVGHTAGVVKNPSFLAVDAAGGRLYAVNELAAPAGEPSGGAVSAFSIDRATGVPRFVNRQSSHGTSPCHLSLDATGRFVLVANYGSGTAAVLPIGADGGLGEAVDVVRHEGAGPNPARQEGPHAHSVNLAPDNRFAFVADLGLDRIMVYAFDAEAGKLRLRSELCAEVAPGAGPRHLAFHPGGAHACVINELNATVTVFAYEAAAGRLRAVQTAGTLPAGYTGKNACAEVQVAPGGRFVYGSNRGHDSLVVYSVDEATGRLRLVGHESTLGRGPRHFAIDPSGTFLLVANQATDSLVVFRIHPETGRLLPTGRRAAVSMPVCVQFAAD